MVCFVAMTHYTTPRMRMRMGIDKMYYGSFAMGWKKEAKLTYVYWSKTKSRRPLLLLHANDKKAALCFERRTTYN